jgi:DNA-binding IclR family transcriptional regulator
MTSALDRGLTILEVLADAGEGLGMQAIAERLDLPKSTTHRVLAELMTQGYVRQDAASARYQLSTKLLSLAFKYMASTGISDAAQPILDRLAHQTGELVRMAAVEGDRLAWVAKAQGARVGLRYDPEMGQDVWLYCTATGAAWLAMLDDAEALRIVTAQGFGKLKDHGPNAPRTIAAFLERLREARKQGYAVVVDSGQLGTAAIAAPIRDRAGAVLATISVAGPSARLTRERMHALAPSLLTAASELATVSGSPVFRAPQQHQPQPERAKRRR